MMKNYILSELCTMKSGGTPRKNRKDFYNGIIPWAKIADIENSNGIVTDTEELITLDGLNSINNRLFPKGTILLAMYGSIGKTAIAGRELSCNQAILGIEITRTDLLDINYFLKWLDYNKKNLIHQGRGVTQKNISKTIVSNLKISLPPLEEQKRIAAILDKADEIRQKRKRAIALAEELLKSTFLDMFGDPMINPKGWEVVDLEKLIIGKPNNGIFRKNDEYGGKIPVIWVKELFSNHILNYSKSITFDPTEQEINKFGLKKGDILFCRSSLKLEGIGYNNVFDGDDNSALFECHIIRISPNQSKINSIFLNHLLRTSSMRKLIISKSNTVTMTTIGQEQIKKIPIILPPKNIQDDFENKFRSIIKLQEKKQTFLQESENLFNSLLQRAFKGEL